MGHRELMRTWSVRGVKMWRAEVSGESRMRTKHLEGSETEVSEGEVRHSVSGRGRTGNPIVWWL